MPDGLRGLLALVAAAAFVQSAYYYDRLPDALASNFDAEGLPNNWSGKFEFFAVYLVIVVTLGLIVALSDAMIARDPEKRLRVPRAEHWLHPARRDATIRRVRYFLLWMGIAATAFAVAIAEFVIQANLERPVVLPAAATWLIVGYLGAAFAATAWFCLGFFRPDRK